MEHQQDNKGMLAYITHIDDGNVGMQILAYDEGLGGEVNELP